MKNLSKTQTIENKKTAAVIRHVHFEDLGTIKDVLAAHKYGVKYYEAGIDNIADIKNKSPDLLIVLGAPIGANEEDKYPFLHDTLKLLKERVASNAPTLGICLGAQLLARALGAKVYQGAAKEIGWNPLTLTSAGKASPLRHLDGKKTSMLHWHGDVFDIPAVADLLASTPVNRNQAFSYGSNILAFQCHPELKAKNFERWLVGHACEIAQTQGVSVSALRADTKKHGAALEEAFRPTINEWLQNIRPSTLTP